MTIATHCLWIGGELSTLDRLALASHVRVGHECHLWAYDAIPNVPQGVILQDAHNILPRARIFTYRRGPGKGSFGAFANLFRYKLLVERGGWWTDIDVVCLRPFQFAEEYVFASERSNSEHVGNCVIKAPAASPVLRHCLGVSQQADPGTLNWGETGPQLIHQAVARFRLNHFVVTPDVFCPLDWQNAMDVLRYRIDLRHSHAVHLWHEVWRRNGWNKNATYPADCLYETLKRRYLPS